MPEEKCPVQQPFYKIYLPVFPGVIRKKILPADFSRPSKICQEWNSLGDKRNILSLDKVFFNGNFAFHFCVSAKDLNLFSAVKSLPICGQVCPEAVDKPCYFSSFALFPVDKSVETVDSSCE
jgi:hypothetical protein